MIALNWNGDLSINKIIAILLKDKRYLMKKMGTGVHHRIFALRERFM